MLRTTYENETELIQAALTLYNDGRGVDIDPCFSTGRFWKGLEQPKLKFDINPQVDGTVKASCDTLPVQSGSAESIMFDPPFVIGQGKTDNGIIRGRFSAFYRLQDLKDLYENSLREFQRVLKPDGIVLFKCQDTVTSGKQFMTHVWIINKAIELGFRVEDLFILVRNRAIIDPKWTKQYHARKTHSYYLVLSNTGVKHVADSGSELGRGASPIVA